MAVNITATLQSIPNVLYEFDVQGLVTGANALTLPNTYGAFPPDGEWTPTRCDCFPYQIGAVGALVTPDLTTIVNTNGSIAITVYSAGNTNAKLEVY